MKLNYKLLILLVLTGLESVPVLAITPDPSN